uniref:IST1 homolog n=1 Tax=Ananas comosus var. bracteatus TaxID=296719 RepID=A0A6V7NY86_ANACO|nr:unnamed protein product [Ananas comosus var. bracteatus]
MKCSKLAYNSHMITLVQYYISKRLCGYEFKTCLNLAISRIKLLRNKREVQLINMRKEIFQYLQTGQEAIARIRVEHVIREQNILAAYEIIELFCEFILARVPFLKPKGYKDCPLELQEAIASVIFASPRCSDLPELMQLRNLFGAKYGKEFVSVASELRPDSSVNRLIIEKLTVRAPPPDLKLKILKAIAHEYNLNWDDSNTEAEFNKKYEDLLDGSQPLSRREYLVASSSIILLPKDGVLLHLQRSVIQINFCSHWFPRQRAILWRQDIFLPHELMVLLLIIVRQDHLLTRNLVCAEMRLMFWRKLELPLLQQSVHVLPPVQLLIS